MPQIVPAGLFARLRDSFRLGAQSPVGRRFAVLAVLCSSVIALFMTALQLFLDYRRDREEVFQSVAVIETTVLPAMAESLWLFDDVLIRSQLNSLINVKGIRHAELRDSGGTVWSAGRRTDAPGQDFDMPVVRGQGEAEQVLGQLSVQADFQEVYRRTLNRAGVILLSNGVKTAVVAACLLVIYQLMIGRHLVSLARHANNLQPGRQPGRLPEHAGKAVGELAQLAEAISRSATASYSYASELDASNQRLQEANKEQAEFTYAVSHDLKSPSNTIGMLIEELEQLSLEDEGALQTLADMKRTNTRMGQLVEDVLNYARIIEERPVFEQVEMGPLLEALKEDLAADIARSGADIRMETLPPVHGHALQLRILFQNLLANAIKFRAPDRAPRIEIRMVPPRSGDRPDQVRISVSDNGIGIPAALRQKVFGLFQRLHASSSYTGSGLGLTICRRIASNHHGSITVTDGINGGTAFEVLLWLNELP
ncbi:hypothetical protein AB838_00985 [Rhodobacteraceae bacterium (ex Bugula neritina AB1)]|nr:hypothetical protein AB838_00985 [Rhodobacteraceae bacterium (ex Bugula neritina AB1)]